MQNDVNTRGHTQWFYFRVTKAVAGQRVKFNLLNFSKRDSMFNRGMKVAVHSKQRYENEGVGWHRAGERISYFENTVKRDTCAEKSFYTLTFTYVFEHADDTVYFAYSVPYTYSDLRKDLLEIESDPRRA